MDIASFFAGFLMGRIGVVILLITVIKALADSQDGGGW